MRMALKAQLDGEGANREVLQAQFHRSRGDVDSLQGLGVTQTANRCELFKSVALRPPRDSIRCVVLCC